MIEHLQLPMNIGEFLSNLASGFLATVFAIPAGLAANRFVVAQAKKEQRKEEATRLYHSLAALDEALLFNILHLDVMFQAHNNDQVVFHFQVDSSAWDVVKNDVIQYLDDPSLRRRIANYFSRIEELRKNESMYLDSTVGTMSALHGSPLKQALSENLPKIIHGLIQEAQMLQQHIRSAQEKIVSKYRLPKNLAQHQTQGQD